MRLAGLVLCVLGAAWSVPQEGQDFWNGVARDELDTALRVRHNTKIAKNVILFIGDGMGPNTLTATRVYKGNENIKLEFEKFPHMGLLKTYTVDKQVPDSAATATALFCGIKANFKTVGVDSSVQYENCHTATNKKAWLKSVIDWAQEAGKDTGFVTTTRVTHATPSTLYSHSASRNWECDATLPEDATQCKDIARQLVEDQPGKNIKVIMGGGLQGMISDDKALFKEPIDPWACKRKDGLDLLEAWKSDKSNRNYTNKILRTTKDLRNLDTDNTDFVLGIFGNSHLSYDVNRDKTENGSPSLEEMTNAAIRMLQKNPKGFLLVVEGGLIDIAHHDGTARKAFDEVIEFEKAITKGLELTMPKTNERHIRTNTVLTDTLLVVTSDHTHTLAISGYPKRGTNILGIAQNSKTENTPYTTLSYATGNKYGFNYTIIDGEVRRKSPLNYNSSSYSYHFQNSIVSDEGTHGGGDVPVYAIGPMAHLFHTSHEQNYVAHVISYAAKIGPYANEAMTSGQSKPSIHINFTSIFICTILIKFYSFY